MLLLTAPGALIPVRSLLSEKLAYGFSVFQRLDQAMLTPASQREPKEY